uniref:UORF n=1 Tax=Trypanosoma cruzi TaxID=5693 RepID=A0A076JJZ8_TRYCR|nr:uORF [Trypanosoma cruzi]
MRKGGVGLFLKFI